MTRSKTSRASKPSAQTLPTTKAAVIDSSLALAEALGLAPSSLKTWKELLDAPCKNDSACAVSSLGPVPRGRAASPTDPLPSLAPQCCQKAKTLRLKKYRYKSECQVQPGRRLRHEVSCAVLTASLATPSSFWTFLVSPATYWCVNVASSRCQPRCDADTLRVGWVFRQPPFTAEYLPQYLEALEYGTKRGHCCTFEWIFPRVAQTPAFLRYTREKATVGDFTIFEAAFGAFAKAIISHKETLSHLADPAHWVPVSSDPSAERADNGFDVGHPRQDASNGSIFGLAVVDACNDLAGVMLNTSGVACKVSTRFDPPCPTLIYLKLSDPLGVILQSMVQTFDPLHRTFSPDLALRDPLQPEVNFRVGAHAFDVKKIFVLYAVLVAPDQEARRKICLDHARELWRVCELGPCLYCTTCNINQEFGPCEPRSEEGGTLICSRVSHLVLLLLPIDSSFVADLDLVVECMTVRYCNNGQQSCRPHWRQC